MTCGFIVNVEEEHKSQCILKIHNEIILSIQQSQTQALWFLNHPAGSRAFVLFGQARALNDMQKA